jgi:hypothetical protein
VISSREHREGKTDDDDFSERMNVLREECGVLSRKLADTGVASLVPEEMRKKIVELSRVLNEMRRKAEAGEDLSGMVAESKRVFREISVGIRKIVGTYGLEE